MDSDSLRVEPLGHDRKNSAYWYFYGTRLYREDYIENTEVGGTITQRQRGRPRDRKRKRRQCRSQEENLVEEEEKEKEVDDYLDINIGVKTRDTVWQVICFTQQDWTRLVDKFRNSVRKSSNFSILRILLLLLLLLLIYDEEIIVLTKSYNFCRNTTLNASSITHSLRIFFPRYQSFLNLRKSSSVVVCLNVTHVYFIVQNRLNN